MSLSCVSSTSARQFRVFDSLSFHSRLPHSSKKGQGESGGQEGIGRSAQHTWRRPQSRGTGVLKCCSVPRHGVHRGFDDTSESLKCGRHCSTVGCRTTCQCHAASGPNVWDGHLRFVVQVYMCSTSAPKCASACSPTCTKPSS